MSRTSRFAYLAVTAGVVVPLLSGCASGLDASTSHEHASVQGGRVSAARLRLNDVYVEPYSGASSVGSSPLPRPTSTLVTAHSGFVAAVIANDGSSALTVTNVTVSAGGTVTPQPAGGNLTVPAGGTLAFTDPVTGASGTRLVLSGTSSPLVTGTLVNVTFAFSNGTSLTVRAPVFVNPWTGSISSPVPTPTS